MSKGDAKAAAFLAWFEVLARPVAFAQLSERGVTQVSDGVTGGGERFDYPIHSLGVALKHLSQTSILAIQFLRLS